MARIGALLRRHDRRPAEPVSAPVLQAGDLSLDRERRTATVRGERVELTKQEFDLLCLMASRPGAVFTCAALLEDVWSDDTYLTDRTLDTVISRLRGRLSATAGSGDAADGVRRGLQVRRPMTATAFAR